MTGIPIEYGGGFGDSPLGKRATIDGRVGTATVIDSGGFAGAPGRQVPVFTLHYNDTGEIVVWEAAKVRLDGP